MAKGERKTIILNPDNPKEKLILDMLKEQYNASEFIKNILYHYVTSNLHDGNSITTQLPHNDNKMIIQLPHDDNSIINQLSHNDNEMITSLSHNDNSNLLIDIDKVSDTDADIDASVPDDPSKNALDFLKNSF